MITPRQFLGFQNGWDLGYNLNGYQTCTGGGGGDSLTMFKIENKAGIIKKKKK